MIHRAASKHLFHRFGFPFPQLPDKPRKLSVQQAIKVKVVTDTSLSKPAVIWDRLPSTEAVKILIKGDGDTISLEVAPNTHLKGPAEVGNQGLAWKKAVSADPDALDFPIAALDVRRPQRNFCVEIEMIGELWHPALSRSKCCSSLYARI